MNKTGIEVMRDGKVRVCLSTGRNRMDVVLEDVGGDIIAKGAMAITKTTGDLRLNHMRIVRGLPRTCTTIATRSWGYLLSGDDSKILYTRRMDVSEEKKQHFNGDMGTFEHGKIHRLLRSGHRPKSWQGLVCKVWGENPLNDYTNLSVVYCLRHPANWMRAVRHSFGLPNFSLKNRSDQFVRYMMDLAEGCSKGAFLFLHHKPEESIQRLLAWDKDCKDEHVQSALDAVLPQQEYDLYDLDPELVELYDLAKEGKYLDCLTKATALYKNSIQDISKYDQLSEAEIKDHNEYHLERFSLSRALPKASLIASEKTQSERLRICATCENKDSLNGLVVCKKAPCCGKNYTPLTQLTWKKSGGCPENLHPPEVQDAT